MVCFKVEHSYYSYDNLENTGSKGVGPCFPIGDCLHITMSTDVGLELGEIAVFIEFVCEDPFKGDNPPLFPLVKPGVIWFIFN